MLGPATATPATRLHRPARTKPLVMQESLLWSRGGLVARSLGCHQRLSDGKGQALSEARPRLRHILRLWWSWVQCAVDTPTCSPPPSAAAVRGMAVAVRWAATARTASTLRRASLMASPVSLAERAPPRGKPLSFALPRRAASAHRAGSTARSTKRLGSTRGTPAPASSCAFSRGKSGHDTLTQMYTCPRARERKDAGSAENAGCVIEHSAIGLLDLLDRQASKYHGTS